MLNHAFSTFPLQTSCGTCSCSSLLKGQHPDSCHYHHQITSQYEPILLTSSGFAEPQPTLPIQSLFFPVLLLLRQQLFQEFILTVGIIQFFLQYSSTFSNFLATHHSQQYCDHKSSGKQQTKTLFKKEPIDSTAILHFAYGMHLRVQRDQQIHLCNHF